jgi:hypothetical protein
MDIPRALAEAAALVAKRTKEVDAILVHTFSGNNCNWILKHLKGKRVKLIIASSNASCFSTICEQREDLKFIRVDNWQRGQLARIPQAIARCLDRGYLSKGERVLCLMGNGHADSTDLLKLWVVNGEEKAYSWGEVMEATVELAVEIASTEIEGKPVGGAFMVGDWKRVLRYSHPLMPNPFQRYKVNVKDRSQWEMIKKISANFDGAFVLADDGLIKAACRRLDVSRRVKIPKGLGTRHHAVAAMTAATSSKGVTVSQEDRFVRVFKGGRLVARIDPLGRILECMKDNI